MDQLSFFSAEANNPRLADLAGVLCGPGQVTAFGRTAARLSVTVDDPWRAQALVAEFARRGVHADAVRAETGLLVRTAFRADLIHLAHAWGANDGKGLPAGFRLTGGTLRLWALAAGQPNGIHYLLAVDEEAPGTHAPLAAACRQLGLPARLAGPRDGRAAVRVTGRRRLATLAELIGAPPPVAASVWPRHGDFAA